MHRGLGLLGGTFDPIHSGHLEIAKAVYEKIGLAEIHLLPCAQPLLRNPPKASTQHRLAMLQLVAAPYPWLKLDERELIRGGNSYTIDTVTELREVFPDIPVCFILGADQLLQFDRWKDWQHILEYVHLVVIDRDHFGKQASRVICEWIDKHETKDASELQSKRFGCIYKPSVEISSVSATQIREKIAACESAKTLVPQAVWDYICEHQLYTS